jgi:hypothetical protein
MIAGLIPQDVGVKIDAWLCTSRARSRTLMDPPARLIRS